ncbi:hypothetical protein NDN08_005559 [Rhodosorus marinus]|uniref:C2H2-type domain-containing protein n=1 Tax=Rhodosorus marinus TaxID=101924 RepID=A0AAV8V1X5_9RHOD|nr:hypothetical protein NDN08_005559 [Rhodosorus marinus]
MDVKELLVKEEDEGSAGEDQYPCGICTMVLESRDAKLSHVRSVHEGLRVVRPAENLETRKTVRKYPCEVCGKTFGSSSVTNRHRRMVHLKERPFSCSICNKSFATRVCVKRHERKTHARRL